MWYIIVLVVFGILYYLSKFGKNETTSNKVSQSNSSSYKFLKDGIHTYEITGIQHYLEGKPNMEYRNFIGHVSTEYNQYDKNAIAVYDTDYDQIGFTPKGHQRAHHTISKMYGGKVLCWGNVKNNNGFWSGYVNIPVGYNFEKLEEIYDKGIILVKAKNNGDLSIHKFESIFAKLTEL